MGDLTISKDRMEIGLKSFAPYMQYWLLRLEIYGFPSKACNNVKEAGHIVFKNILGLFLVEEVKGLFMYDFDVWMYDLEYVLYFLFLPV
jgi:hypothetical protein